MRAGLVRVQYWALDDAGARVELIATIEQEADGSYARVFTADARPIERVLQLKDGDAWRDVRAERWPAGPPRVLPGPYDR